MLVSMLATLLLAFSFISFLKGLLMFLVVLGALLLIFVILLQEPKGGGLSSAFGGAGAETFGVQSGGINKFTAYVAILFMGCSVLYAAIRPPDEEAHTDRTRKEAPADPTGELGAPPSDTPPSDTAPSDTPPADEPEGAGDKPEKK